jgi:hypothetical protein
MQMKKIAGLLALTLLLLLIPSASPAQVAVGISVHIAPPALPVYVQPICPGPGYLWTPGYWAYGDDGYYWVPGTWLLAPEPGFLWTPGYWGWGGGAYIWHAGYWGPHVGFYGGINYGFGYGGVGFYGGEWRGREFHYNTAVTNVNTTIIHNTYVNRTVINNNTTINRVSYNGGHGGINARPSGRELAAEHEHHIAPTSVQAHHEQAARGERELHASVNHGRPTVAATGRPGEFHGSDVVRTRSSDNSSHRPMNNEGNADRPGSHGSMNHGETIRNDRPPNAHTNNAPNSMNDRANMNKPNTNRQESSRPNTHQSNVDRQNSGRPNTNQPNSNHQTAPRPNNDHQSQPHQQGQGHPQQSHEHEGSGHPGGGGGGHPGR